jgi:hypothetical protein
MYHEQLYRSQGLFQGYILSPFLFNVYIDELAAKLNAKSTALLFADDILFFAKNLLTAKSCLKTADDWSKEYYMEFNAKKSASMGSSGKLSINGQSLPQARVYKYLGVPFEYNGVNWHQHLQTSISKCESFRSGIAINSCSWPSFVRLTIYRTFIRPIMEYALPLVTNWLRYQDKLTQDTSNELIESKHNDAISWIFNKKGYITLLNSLSGLGNASFRLKQLEASLATHLHKLNPANPLHKMKGHLQFRHSKDDFLLTCFQAEMLNEFKIQKDLKWKSFVTKMKLLSLYNIKGTLHKYVNKSCHTPTGMDRCMQHESADIFIRWRANSYFINRLCICKERFTRKHLIQCLQLPQIRRRRDNSDQYEIANYNY